MKKYKLIKKYPGSPELGTISFINQNNVTVCDPVKGMRYYMSSQIDFKNYSEFWQEIVEKEYEILSIKCKATGGDLIYTNNNKGYFTVGLGSISLEDVYLGHLKGSKDIKINIYSVKRLSDGEIFTIGDKIKGLSQVCIINKIWLNPRCNTRILFNHLDEGIRLKNAIKTKQPLFTTEDHVDIFEGDDFYELIVPGFHNKECVWNILPNIGRPNLIYDQEGNRKHFRLWFSTKTKAEEYIIMNNPCLSINDIIEFGNDPIMGIPYRSIDKYKTLVKEKLNL